MNTRKRTIWKKVLLIVAIVIVIVASVGVYLGARWKKIAEARLKTEVYRLSGGFYRIGIGGIHVEILRRQVRIDDIRLYPDSAVFARLQAADSLPPIYANVLLGSVEVRGIRILKASNERALELKNVRFDAPRIEITHTGKERRENSNDTVPMNLYQRISPVFSSLNIHEVDISNGSLQYTAWKGADTICYLFERFDLEASHFLVDSMAETRRRMLYCDDVRLKVHRFRHTLPTGLFAASFDKMEIGLADSLLAFDSLKLTPQYDKQHFAARNPRHTNWMELSIDNVRCLQVDYPQLLSGKSVHIDSISIAGLLYTNMKNREVEQAPIVKPMLYDYVQNAMLPLYIRTIHVQQAKVVYEDLPKGKTAPGVLTLDKIEGDFYGITNITTSQGQYMTVKAKAYVQGEGLLRATFQFPVDPANNHFRITGSLGKMRLPRLNSMIEPFMVNIDQGVVDHIDFTINGNNRQSELDMVFLYNDLHVALLKEADRRLVTKNFLSGIANGLILLDQNPDNGKEPRQAHTVTQRNVYRASFHYFWHTLMDGLVETIGITKKRQEQIKKVRGKR